MLLSWICASGAGFGKSKVINRGWQACILCAPPVHREGAAGAGASGGSIFGKMKERRVFAPDDPGQRRRAEGGGDPASVNNI